MLRNLLAVSIATVAFGAGHSWAAVGDACTPDVVDATTGQVTTDNFTERCDTTALIVCPSTGANANKETAVECSTFGGTTGGACTVEAGGPTCTAADGQGCFFLTQDGQGFPISCTTPDSGCINGQCTPGQGTCTPPAAGAGADPVCAGDLIDFGCTADGQNLQLSCGLLAAANAATTPSASATCTGSGAGLKCIGAVAGDSCATGFIECGAGLSCQGESQTAFGTCTAGGTGEGEGEGEGAAGGDACTVDSDCGRDKVCTDGACVAATDGTQTAPCSTTGTNPVMPVFAGFAVLLALPMFRRRRA